MESGILSEGKSANKTTLFILRDEEEFSFEVPTDWLTSKLMEDDVSLEEFLDEYTSDESSDIYGLALLEGVTEEIQGSCDD